ncbi:biotin--[acetyl-CoA-carboxylase] ligase [Nitrosomonas sp. Nm166]|uniref:biotin--[acetyl-CoA-carboxylase] ligase n=1 Tax=Nitrosomonas sp. Nm166 TaxID=1881054 RepID=UPI0008E2EFCC|nr:biotin--[acetyl-CoA-carboxylase] ligase [Nitrosomonas sp. Nm166]SFE88098.1 BirA family transcriptional regulator, biotin operon repressor / biotin-[acetyl-CoA-carboxylase] ligase [Nitrosomonas sp. Nm166]
MNQLIFSILRLLSDGKFYSDVSIAEQLQCSHAEVLNAIKQIDNYGVNLTKHCERNYRWETPIQWLNSDSILSSTCINSNFFNIKIFDLIDSTNNFLLNNLENRQIGRCDCIPVVAAELQTNGRGRIGRNWYSGLGDSLTFSLGWRFEQSISSLSGLSLTVGIAIIRVLNSFSIQNVSLKWPNDILFDHYKLAGVLIELRREIRDVSYAVIGIGINFNLSEKVKSAITQQVTDLFAITGKYIDRNLLFGALLSELRSILMSFEKYGFAHFKKEWISYHGYEGKNIYLTLPNNLVIEGIIDGINNDGALSLKTSTGRNFYNVGDVSIRTKQP